MKLSIHAHLVSRLGMSGCVTPPVPYAFVSGKRKIRFACSSKPCPVGSTAYGRAYIVTEHF
jgi:hypothetical protein